jgi:DNA-binding MarR family transcriptional regulator
MSSSLEEFANSLRIISKHFKKKMHEDSESLSQERSVKDCRIIEVVGESKKTMSEISKELELTPGSTTTCIEKLIEGTLFEREYDKLDRRKIYIILTPQGKKIYKTLSKNYLEISKDLLEPLSIKERETFIKLIKKSLEGVEK